MSKKPENEEPIKPEEKPPLPEEKPAAAEEKQKDIDEYKDKYLRALAEIENMRKRLQKEKEEVVRYTVENTIGEFLNPLDNLDNALKFADQASEEVKKWAIGFQMIVSQFREVLHNHGIVPFHSEGCHFDPHYHEVMEIVETDEFPDGKILEEFSKGYKSSHRVIKPARVKIVRKPEFKENSPK